MHLQARTPTAGCCTRREKGPVGVEDEAMEAADVIMEGGTEVMPTATLDPLEIGGVEAMRTGKGRPSRSAGTVARKAIEKASAGKSAPIRREPDPETVPDRPTREIGSDRTTLSRFSANALSCLSAPDRCVSRVRTAEVLD